MKNLLFIAFILFCFIPAIPVEANPKESSQEEVAKIQVKSSTQIGVIEALRSASLVVQLTMVLLGLMSIVSWSVILSKWNLFKNNKTHNIPLEDIFFKASSMDEIFDLSKSYPKSSLVTVFRAGYSELKKIIKSKSSSQASNSSLLSGMDNLQRALNKAVNNQISYMERRLPFLATTGSVSPFIGLFGTVFGIMDSFQQIGIMGSANLAVVAPGISEALIATGFGLFVAIPAAVFYNHFINELKKAELEFNNFVTDFLNISKRNFFK
ncbi:MAG: protein TolQ [Oligoflexia bacterium]|nr:MotA/TolQ/ExbB proton channel family protein [Bdellovibrionales bacterium]MYE07924.1 protein TolQ [Oligoflexia bacterium]